MDHAPSEQPPRPKRNVRTRIWPIAGLIAAMIAGILWPPRLPPIVWHVRSGKPVPARLLIAVVPMEASGYMVAPDQPAIAGSYDVRRAALVQWEELNSPKPWVGLRADQSNVEQLRVMKASATLDPLAPGAHDAVTRLQTHLQARSRETGMPAIENPVMVRYVSGGSHLVTTEGVFNGVHVSSEYEVLPGGTVEPIWHAEATLMSETVLRGMRVLTVVGVYVAAVLVMWRVWRRSVSIAR